MKVFHQPVMVSEVLEGLNVRKKGVYVDGTVGEGGHAQQILEHSGPEGFFIGLDRDETVLETARQRLEAYGQRVTLIHENYAHLGNVLSRFHITRVSGILLDLGYSSYQMDNPKRGFSFMSTERLDMRFDMSQTTTAYDLVNGLSREKLKELFRKFGEERWAGKIAALIAKERSMAPIETAYDLSRIVTRAIPSSSHRGIHPATKIFQALRIAVNDELEHLQRFMKAFPEWLSESGRIVVISYHSLEDRIVKNAIKYWAARCRCPKELPRCMCEGNPLVKILTPRPLSPSSEELTRNPRSRSAKMRVAERI
jgi:16S rRNA (cytosine1402-N4)-methyltransferase